MIDCSHRHGRADFSIDLYLSDARAITEHLATRKRLSTGDRLALLATASEAASRG